MAESDSSVAIISRTKDRTVFIPRLCASVLNQSHEDWVHIIVNDGGAAQPLEAALAPFRDQYRSRLKILHLPTSQGMQSAANAGIAGSESTFIAIHDDDDSWHPDFLRETVSFLNAKGAHSLYQGVVTHTEQVWERLDNHSFAEVRREPYIPLPEINFLRIGYENPFPPISLLYRRQVLDTLGNYDQSLNVAGDLDFNFRFLSRYEIGLIPQSLAFYHWRESSSDPTALNSVLNSKAEHALRLNEFQNKVLREQSVAGLAINLAGYLLRQEWHTRLLLNSSEKQLSLHNSQAERTENIGSRILRQLGEGDQNGRLSSVSDALVRLIEATKDLKTHLATHDHDKPELLSAINAYFDRFQDQKEHLTSISNMQEDTLARLTLQQEQATMLTNELKALRGRILFKIGPLHLMMEKPRKKGSKESR